MRDTSEVAAVQASIATAGEDVGTDEASLGGAGSGRVGKNLVYLLLSQLATWSASLVVLIWVPELLGSTDYGKFGFSIAFVQFFLLGASLGSMTLLTRTIAREPDLLASYVYNALIMKVVLAVVLSAAAVGLAAAIGKSGEVVLLVGLACVGMLFLVLNEVWLGALQGLEVMGRPAMWAAVQVFVASGVGLLVLAVGGGVVAYAAAFAFAAIVPLIANGRKVWPWLHGSRRLDAGVWRRLVVGGAPLMVLVSLNRFYGTIDIPILDGIAGEATVGWYTLAYRWVTIPIFIATAAVTAFFPSFSAHGATVSDEFVRLVNQALRLVVTVSVPAAVGLAVIAGDLRELIYGADYEPFVPILQILALHIPLVAVGVILGTALIASDRQNKYIAVSAAAAVLNPIACIFAIRWAVDEFDNGAIGAALVTVGTEVFVLCGAFAVRSKGVMDRRVAWLCARIVVAGLLMAGAVALVEGLSMLARIAVGALAYVAASIALQTVTVGEVRRGFDVMTRTMSSLRRPTRSSGV